MHQSMASFYVLTFRCHWWAGVRSGYDLACGSPLRLSARKEPAHWDPPYERREERDPPAGSFGGSISGYVFSRVADDETFVSDSWTSKYLPVAKYLSDVQGYVAHRFLQTLSQKMTLNSEGILIGQLKERPLTTSQE